MQPTLACNGEWFVWNNMAREEIYIVLRIHRRTLLSHQSKLLRCVLVNDVSKMSTSARKPFCCPRDLQVTVSELAGLI